MRDGPTPGTDVCDEVRACGWPCVHRAVARHKLRLYVARHKLQPYMARHKLQPYMARHKLRPYVARHKPRLYNYGQAQATAL